MHQYKGKLIVHTGSMFSGKTSSLEKDMKRFVIAGYSTLAFKPTVDTRYDSNEIKTHDNTILQAILVDTVDDIVRYVEDDTPSVIGIDEVQFLGGKIEDIVKSIKGFLNNDITVIIAGLDMDFEGEPFEIVKELMPLSDYLYKHHAVCVNCGTDAWVSHRKIGTKERVVIGATREYEPLCRRCFLKEKEIEDDIVNKNQVEFDIK
ncbi:thymidine kinase [Tissierella creatinophila]|uniref:Thymidine kinase n=1 Tax=Tissierella creatinophila DSM 6911 TaxID=1123403 RepID=A0A1U7M9A3_TISCR|nr:thymidine kinase [Tissierella creatinophila]OLS03865.1 thymidine kinase [Tissierella creatinophila DSM 6911]